MKMFYYETNMLTMFSPICQNPLCIYAARQVMSEHISRRTMCKMNPFTKTPSTFRLALCILHTVKLVVLLLTYSQMGTTEAVFQTFNVNVLRMSHFHLFASTIMKTLVGMNHVKF